MPKTETVELRGKQTPILSLKDDVGVIDRDGSEVVVARTVPSAHARIQISPKIIPGHNIVSVVVALKPANRRIRVGAHSHIT